MKKEKDRKGDEYKGATAQTERKLTFPRTPILITLPLHYGEGLTIHGVLNGIWTTRLTSRTTFIITGFAARLKIPELIIREPKKENVQLKNQEIPIEFDYFDISNNLSFVFGRLNSGVVDPKTRFLSGTLGLSAQLPPLLGRPAESCQVILRTIGLVGREGLQIGGGSGTVLSGLLAGTILCCAGFRGRIPPQDDEPATPPPTVPTGPLVQKSNVEVERDIGTQGDPDKIPDRVKRESLDPLTEARGQFAAAIDLLDKAGVFDDLNAQLMGEGLSIRIKLTIQVQDGLRVIGLGGLTNCGDPIEIIINISDVLNFTILKQALAHELVHAKECAYTNAGKPAPYGGHDTDPFKNKVKEYEEKVKEYEEAKSQSLHDDLEEFMQEHQEGD